MNVKVEAVGGTTSLADRKRRAGQRLIISVAGPSVDDDLRRLVKEVRPAGFVLFGRNIVEPAQVRELNRELASLVDPGDPALIAVDQEGGRVQRIGEPATPWPSMHVVARAGSMTADVARAMGRELRALGFDLDFAPVADVDGNPENRVIGDRSFGGRPDEVSQHVATFVKALQAEHVIACAKHFPGHTDGTGDSHKTLPVVERDEPDLRHIDLPPFAAAVAAGVGAVMTSHVLYPAWDEELPSTLSPRIVPRLLRKELGYDGVVFSDDLHMKALDRWTQAELVPLATAATVDVLLACKRIEQQHDLFRELVLAQEVHPSVDRAFTTSFRRVERLRERFFIDRPPQPGLDVVGCQEHRMLAALVRARAE